MAVPCNKHPGFNGLRLGKKAAQCPECLRYYNERKKEGTKESRKRRTKAEIEAAKAAETNTEPEVVVAEEPVQEDLAENEQEIDNDEPEVIGDSDDDDDDEVSLDDLEDLL